MFPGSWRRGLNRPARSRAATLTTSRVNVNMSQDRGLPRRALEPAMLDLCDTEIDGAETTYLDTTYHYYPIQSSPAEAMNFLIQTRGGIAS